MKKDLSRNITCWPLCQHRGHTTGRCLLSNGNLSLAAMSPGHVCTRVAQQQGVAFLEQKMNIIRMEVKQVELTTSVKKKRACDSWLPPLSSSSGAEFSPLGCVWCQATRLTFSLAGTGAQDVRTDLPLSWGFHRQLRNTAHTLLWGLGLELF